MVAAHRSTDPLFDGARRGHGPRTTNGTVVGPATDRQQRRRLPASHTGCDRGGQRCNHQGRRQETFLDFFAGIGVLNVGHSNPYVLGESTSNSIKSLIRLTSRPRHESNSSNGLTTSHLTVLAETARSYSVDRAEATRSKGRSSSPNTTPAAMACSPSRDLSRNHGRRAQSHRRKSVQRGVRAAVGRRRPRPVPDPTEPGPTGDVEPFCPPKPVAKTVPVRVRWTRCNGSSRPVWRTRITRRNLGSSRSR